MPNMRKKVEEDMNELYKFQIVTGEEFFLNRILTDYQEYSRFGEPQIWELIDIENGEDHYIVTWELVDWERINSERLERYEIIPKNTVVKRTYINNGYPIGSEEL